MKQRTLKFLGHILHARHFKHMISNPYHNNVSEVTKTRKLRLKVDAYDLA